MRIYNFNSSTNIEHIKKIQEHADFHLKNQIKAEQEKNRKQSEEIAKIKNQIRKIEEELKKQNKNLKIKK